MIQGLMAEVVADFRRSGDALYMQYRFADALASYEKALVEIAREDAPALWAGTMVNIGLAHGELGIRMQAFEAKEHLRLAINAYRGALEVYTRDQLTQDWAMTQNNLGALQEQGIRTGGAQGTELLAQAVAAYRSALEVRTRETFPSYYELVRKNLDEAEALLAVVAREHKRFEPTTSPITARSGPQ